MTETYSLAITGVSANQKFGVANVTLGDSSATLGGQAAAMQNNTRILCQRADGSQRHFVIDAERSLPGMKPILIPAPS